MTNRDRILIGAMACLVAVAGFWFLALKPKRAAATAAVARVADAQTKLNTANEALASATSARASFRTDYATAARLGKAVPDDDDAASLVFQLETAARKAGLDFRSLTVGGAGTATSSTPAQTGSSSSSSKAPSGTAGSGSSTPATGTTGATGSTGAAAGPPRAPRRCRPASSRGPTA